MTNFPRNDGLAQRIESLESRLYGIERNPFVRPAATYYGVVYGSPRTIPISTGPVSIGLWDMSFVPNEFSWAWVALSVTARCPAGNQAIDYKLQWSGNSGSTYTEFSDLYVHNYGDAYQALGGVLAGAVDLRTIDPNGLRIHLTATTGAGAGVTNFGNVHGQSSFFK